MDSETADILGGRLPVIRDGSTSSWSLTGRLYFTAGASLFLWLCWLRVGPYWRQYRETQYRKAMRRRHGIPDNDHRPFNVAYAAATRARQESEAEARRSRKSSIEPHASLHTSIQVRPASKPYVKQRPTQIDHQQFATYSDPVRFSTGLIGDNDLLSVDDRKASTLVGASRSHSGRRSRLNTLPTYGKHSLEEEEEDASVDQEKGSKKSRIDGDEQVDGNEDAGWDVDGAEDREDPGMEVDEDVYATASQSHMQSLSADDDNIASGSGRRLRKISRGKFQMVDIDQEMEDADLANDLPSIPRGRKRDRGEAGSVFGGDDSVMGEDEGRAKRHTRRRTASHKKTSVSSRGQKRGRDAADSLDSDEEDSAKPMKRTMRQRRGQQPSDGSDLSIDDGMVSHDPLCKGRRIGEEWEVNGILYRVGPNGQRLRQALVKRSRSRFPMPKDSEHPDRSANINVFVETWLSDDQYQYAKERHELAWQESPRLTTAEPDTPGDVPDITPAKSGKNLLWSSTMKDSPTAQRRSSRHSIVATVGLRINPFDQSQMVSGRRISAVQSTPILPPDSPKLRSSKSYSKWEKQDLEAVAMAKLREKAQKQIVVTPEKPTPPGVTPATNGVPGDKKEPAFVNSPASNLSNYSSVSSTPKTSTVSEPARQPFSFVAQPSSSEAPKTSSVLFPLPAPALAPATTPNSTANVATGAPTTPTFSLGNSLGVKLPAPSVKPTDTGSSGLNLFGPSAPSAPATPFAGSSFLNAPKAPIVSSVPNASMPPPAPAAPSSGVFAAKPQSQQTINTTNEVSTPSASQSNMAVPSFSFSSSALGAQPLATGNGSPLPTKPTESTPSSTFRFGDSKAEKPKVAEGSSTPAPASLFSRIGGIAPQPASSTSTLAPTGAGNSSFSFGKTPAPASTVLAGNRVVESTSGSAAASGAAPLKFNFFGGSNTTNPSNSISIPSAGAPSAPSLSQPSVAATSSSTGSIFAGSSFVGFGNRTATDPANKVPAGNATLVPPSTSAGNSFGAVVATTNPFGKSGTVPAAPAVTKPHSFSFGNSSVATNSSSSTMPTFSGSSMFGSSTPAVNNSAFKATPTPLAEQSSTQTQSAFAGFGSKPNASGNGPPTAFGSGTSAVLGTNNTPTTPAAKANESESKPVSFKFNFGAPAPSAPNSATPASFSSAPASSGPAVNNRATQPSLTSFGFGAPSSTSNSSSNAFSFGTPSTQK